MIHSISRTRVSLLAAAFGLSALLTGCSGGQNANTSRDSSQDAAIMKQAQQQQIQQIQNNPNMPPQAKAAAIAALQRSAAGGAAYSQARDKAAK